MKDEYSGSHASDESMEGGYAAGDAFVVTEYNFAGVVSNKVAWMVMKLIQRRTMSMVM